MHLLTIPDAFQATARMAVLMCHQTKEKEKRFEWGEKTWSTCSGPQRDYMMKVVSISEDDHYPC